MSTLAENFFANSFGHAHLDGSNGQEVFVFPISSFVYSVFKIWSLE